MTTSIDQQFIEYIVKSLVGNPDAVKIKRTIDEMGVLLELTVDPEDLGRVIGKRGATAQSLRTLLRALGTKNDARYNLKIVDTGSPPPKPATTEPTEKPAPAAKSAKSAPPDDSSATDDDIVSPDEEAADHSSVISKTRKELAELDDLDV
jgi:hypothetical protein